METCELMNGAAYRYAIRRRGRQKGAYPMRRTGRRSIFAVGAIAFAAIDYAWVFGYYRRLYQGGKLLSAADASSGTIRALFLQNLLVNVPVVLMAAVVLLAMKGRFIRHVGLHLPHKRSRASVGISLGVYLALLAAALLRQKETALAIVYQWIYYLVFVALSEECEFRAFLPWLLEKGGLPGAYVWAIAGVLFGCMHTLIPLVKGSGAAQTVELLFSGMIGYMVMSYAMYRARLWSGTLWLPVLIHAALDFLGVIV